MDDSDKIRRILRTSKTLAVVGLSAQWHRPSFFAARYMQEHGYRVIPVNPGYDTIMGEKCYKKLSDIPEKVDIVDCFRKSSEIGAIADEA
ncbi:MAG TPA: CoA-binding protein, partial [Usitatibacter sp.]|nr:CoA-binding protein [Usitatibacter sp.]